MIPSNRLIYSFLFGVILALVYSIIPVFGKLWGWVEVQDYYQLIAFKFWGVYMMLLILVAVLDIFSEFRSSQIAITRNLPNSLSIGTKINVEIEIRHHFTRTTNLRIFDHYPSQTLTEFLPLTVQLLPGKTTKTSYPLQPIQRGKLVFGKVQYRSQSPLGLWHRHGYAGTSCTVKVYPDFNAIKKYILLGVNDRTSQLGIKLRQRRGTGLEFHRLRNYRMEDSMRQIDWKATSKKRTLISREYQDEQDQQVFFLLDCGRRMRSKDGLLSHFDHALNSMLLLSYVALRQGDAVGLMSFSGEKNVWLQPLKGSSSINTILNTVYDLQPCISDSDYRAAAEKFYQRQKKRSLVVLISNSRDENIEELLATLNFLRKRHLVLFANLQEQVLRTIMKTPITNFDQAISYASTVQFFQHRQEGMKQLNMRGVITLDVTTEKLPVAILNNYHRLKRSGQL